jgi:crotonobetainyl-CoA:carnitine CoA-transferase CaiB-like acyl-CoA transferase
MGDYIPAGVRGALDIAIMVREPSCLPPVADLGGEVNKVEPPKGDYIRTAA